MPNRKTKAGHIPLRTCVICRHKQPQAKLLRFGRVVNGIVYDLKHKMPGRGYYVCNKNECILKLDRWLRKKKK